MGGETVRVRMLLKQRNRLTILWCKVECLKRDLKQTEALAEELHSALRAEQAEKAKLQVSKCIDCPWGPAPLMPGSTRLLIGAYYVGKNLSHEGYVITHASRLIPMTRSQENPFVSGAHTVGT